jgi:hypothetical protein
MARLREQFGRIFLWRWEIARFLQTSNKPYEIIYIGRKARLGLAKSLLGINENSDENHPVTDRPNRKVFVSEMPVPGALRVPWYLITIIPLGQPLAELTASYDKKLRQLLRNNLQRYHTQQALDDADIDRANREMLMPYATARRGDDAVQLQAEEVRRMAQKIGRLDLLYADGEVVGCHLGYPISRSGKRYWAGLRVGFPDVVFSDSKRLHEANSINNYLALEWAVKNGFDYYDNGTCLARPDDGLLQWKRRRGGAVDKTGNRACFYIRLPKDGVAQFLWDTPLFVVERNNLTLHLGVPEGLGNEEVASRYRDMGFGGLFKVYLHCAGHVDDSLLGTLRNLYKHEKLPPAVEITLST